MSPLLDLWLIRLYGFYLGVSFLLSTVAYFRQYRAILGLVRSMPGRWPRLLKLVLQHLNLFLTWQTLLPLFLTLGLLLANTLVLVSSEFGRTPKINNTAGRDHWPKVFSVVLAGGGIRKGSVYGSSDATASEPEEDALTVEDLSATVYHCLGINHEKKLLAPGNRPIDIVREAKVRKELLA